ncbi:uncharacterized protein ISCGN_013428 [Ixodes scapularis]
MKPLSLLWLTSGLWVSTLVCWTARCEAQDAGGSKSENESGLTMFKLMTSLLSEAIGNPSSPAARRVLRAEVSSSCSLGLLRFVRALKTSEPWVLRFLDASAKFPNGLLQGTMADLGAFDECVETVIYDQFGREDIRGQYCNVDIRIVNDTSIEDFLRPAATLSHRRSLPPGKAVLVPASPAHANCPLTSSLLHQQHADEAITKTIDTSPPPEEARDQQEKSRQRKHHSGIRSPDSAVYTSLLYSCRFFDVVLSHMGVNCLDVAYTDFDIGDINAIQVMIPDTSHDSQSVYRKVCSSGHQSRYNSDEEFAVLDLLGVFPTDGSLVADYFEDVYIGRSRRNGLSSATSPLWFGLKGVVIGVGLDDTVGPAEPLQDTLGGCGCRVQIQWVVFFGPSSSTGKVGRDTSLT